MELDEALGFSASGNSEIRAAWLAIAVRAGHRAVDASLEQFLLEVGRRKFLKPLYEACEAHALQGGPDPTPQLVGFGGG